ncbi:GGDEF domain-containing protein [Chitinimonas naiadis]
MSLRLKLILALLFTSLMAVALVGGVAYLRVNGKFDDLRRHQAEDHFRGMVTAYLQRYGSWQAGEQQEGFHAFVARQPRPEGPPGRPDDESGTPGPRRPPPPEGRGQDPRAPRGEPPFHFILADAGFRVLLGAGSYHPDELLPEHARRDAQAVVINGKVLAYISPEGVLGPSKQEQEYLGAMREGLLYGAGIAAALAILLGLLLAGRLSGALHRLTLAVEAMAGGKLLQRVPVQGRDEVAKLGQAFNTMSEELAQSHASLQASHQTILAQAAQLKEMSIRDALTELYNRRHFDEQARQMYEQARRYGHPLTVVIADIDFFKRINDQFSHATGDTVLRQVAAILQSHVRQSDLVARYGGEEFVIALPETALPQAAALCEKLRDMLERFPWQQLHPDLRVTMSMGLCADLEANGLEAMLQQADERLYRAKAEGRNRIRFG